MNERWFTLDVNPDPWAIGPLQLGKRNGKFFPHVGPNRQLLAYKETVAELLGDITPLEPGEYDLSFYFWRRLDGSGRNVKHSADATNLQKATEDALQGILFGNDRDVRKISSEVVEQGPDVRPMVVIRAQMYDGLDPSLIPSHVWEQIDKAEMPALFDDNVWMGPQ